MARVHAEVATAHASRYLQQLYKHWSHRFAVEFARAALPAPEGAAVPQKARQVPPALPRGLRGDLDCLVINELVAAADRLELASETLRSGEGSGSAARCRRIATALPTFAAHVVLVEQLALVVVVTPTAHLAVAQAAASSY